jgi:hypothetical protein
LRWFPSEPPSFSCGEAQPDSYKVFPDDGVEPINLLLDPGKEGDTLFEEDRETATSRAMAVKIKGAKRKA